MLMVHIEHSPRRGRYRPQSTGKRLSLKPRDFQWLKALRDHGPLTGPFLHRFSEHDKTSEKAALRRLTDLASETNTPHDGAYLVRPVAQKQNFNAMSRPLIYDLAPAGFKALATPKSQLTRPTGPFPHQVMVAAVTASIELGCKPRTDVRFISGQSLLDRAFATLGVDMEFTNPATGSMERHRLVPDALFAIEYTVAGRKQYRAFVVECDRGTEPITAKSFARKSYERSHWQYKAFIEGKLFREAYGLNCNLLVLNVMAQRARGEAFLKLIKKLNNACPFMLFQELPDFAENIVPKHPYSKLLERRWYSARQDPFFIDQP
jgi:hypothetical protein